MRIGGLLLLGLAGCFQSAGDGILVAGSTAHGRSSSGGGGSTSAESSTTSAATSSGSVSTVATSGGSSGGSSPSSGSSSGGSEGPDAGIDCPDVYIETRFYDGLLETPIAGLSAEALDADGVPIPGSATITNADGVGVCCVPHGVQVTLTATATGYPPMYLENVVLSQPWVFGLATADGGSANGLLMLSTSTLEAVAPLLSTPLNPSQPVVVVSVATLNPKSTCRAQKAGWLIGVTQPDGGVIPNGQYFQTYMGLDDLPDPDAGVTTLGGTVLIYNIDLSISQMRVTAVNTNLDAGECPSQNGSIGLTGIVETNNGELTYAPIILP